jgi:preprotein translocase subunit SecY
MAMIMMTTIIAVIIIITYKYLADMSVNIPVQNYRRWLFRKQRPT